MKGDIMTSARVKRIVSLERQAVEFVERAEVCRWDAARLIAEELDAGKTQRLLAREIDRSQAHVNYMASAWRKYGRDNLGDRPSFNAAYQRAKRAKSSKPRKPAGARTPEPPEQKEPQPEPQPKDDLPAWMRKPSSDELASSIERDLKHIDSSRLSSLGWKYLEKSRGHLDQLFEQRGDRREVL